MGGEGVVSALLRRDVRRRERQREREKGGVNVSLEGGGRARSVANSRLLLPYRRLIISLQTRDKLITAVLLIDHQMEVFD